MKEFYLHGLLSIAMYLAWIPAVLADNSEVTELTVAADGSGDFLTVQAAVDAVPEGNSQRVVIHIRPGAYHERIEVPRSKPFITFQGEDPRRTILTYNLNAHSLRPDGEGGVGTTGSSSTFLKGDDFTARNVTFANATPEGIGQAVAVKVEGDRMIFDNVRFIGWQDTLYAHGRGQTATDSSRQYYRDCYIEGGVDFIFGAAAAVFENCEIRSKRDGYVTAASTPEFREFGYVFINCRLTRGDEVGDRSVYLGRPWRPYASVTFIKCEMNAHIRPEGWHNWGDADNEKTARYAEFGSTGPGGAVSQRAEWSSRLSAEVASGITPASVLAGDDGWNPPDRPNESGNLP